MASFASVYRDTFEKVLIDEGPASRPALVMPVRAHPQRTYFFFVTPTWTRSKMPYSKSITVSVMPLSHGLRRYLVAE